MTDLTKRDESDLLGDFSELMAALDMPLCESKQSMGGTYYDKPKSVGRLVSELMPLNDVITTVPDVVFQNGVLTITMPNRSMIFNVGETGSWNASRRVVDMREAHAEQGFWVVTLEGDAFKGASSGKDGELFVFDSPFLAEQFAENVRVQLKPRSKAVAVEVVKEIASRYVHGVAIGAIAVVTVGFGAVAVRFGWNLLG